ncbi:MAG: SHOCT domain-containing protein [Prevotella sp.]|nr:SHOCT domain-containing protein [Prevotella sp.]
MEWFWIILIIAVLLGIGFALNAADEKETQERKDVLDAKMEKLPNQQSFKKIIGQKNRYIFVLDNIGRKIYYIDTTKTDEVFFEQIISVEILEDNTLLSSKSTTRTVGGALLGGALAGGAGLVVGGLSGDSKQKKKVSKITVKIKLRDYSNPSLLIPCFVAKELTPYDEIKTNDNLYGVFYKQELQNAQKIADYVSIIIDEVDRQEKQSQVGRPTSAEGLSVADELKKLASLKEQGILSEEEFQVQKEKLLK